MQGMEFEAIAPSVLWPYLVAVLIVVISPGPDNILAIGRGLSQGPMAAVLSSIGAGLGIMVHTLAAALGLSLILQTTPWAFWVVKLVGAAYLLWIGWKALTSRNLVVMHQTKARVFLAGVLSNVLNPKPGLFVAAFIPQFVVAEQGHVLGQMMTLGAIFAVITAVVFSVLGSFASRLSVWLIQRPRIVAATNVGAGLAFVGAALSVLLIERRPTT
jgi:threonine/homoserine/homoserine lactone efflux protein